MSRAPRRDVAVVGAFVVVSVLLSSMQAEAADAPALEAPTTTGSVVPPASTSSSSTTSSTTTTTAPAGDPVEEAIHRWFADVEQRAREIAWCESSHDPRAVSPGGGNHGLFQINRVHRGDFPRVTGVSFADGVYDPNLNAQFARWLFDREGWEPWGCA